MIQIGNSQSPVSCVFILLEDGKLGKSLLIIRLIVNQFVAICHFHIERQRSLSCVGRKVNFELFDSDLGVKPDCRFVNHLLGRVLQLVAPNQVSTLVVLSRFLLAFCRLPSNYV